MASDPNSSHRFLVEIGGKAVAAFTECTLPTLEFDTLEQKEGGLNDYVHVLPGQRKSGRLILKRGLTSSTELFDWYMDLLSGKITKAKRTIAVIMYDLKGNEMSRWDFTDALPVKWSGPQLKADQAAVAIETLELVIHEFIPN